MGSVDIKYPTVVGDNHNSDNEYERKSNYVGDLQMEWRYSYETMDRLSTSFKVVLAIIKKLVRYKCKVQSRVTYLLTLSVMDTRPRSISISISYNDLDAIK